jgi:hypothetical protein
MKKAHTKDCLLSSGDLKPENSQNSEQRRKTSVKVVKNTNDDLKKNITKSNNMDNNNNNSNPINHNVTIRKRSKPNLSPLTLTNLSLDYSEKELKEQGKSPIISTSSPSLNSSNSPSQFHGTFWRQVLATTPPTGRKPLTPVPTSSSSTFFPTTHESYNGFEGEKGKRRNSLPAKLDYKNGVPKISPQLDYLFQEFLSTQENWELILQDITEVEIGKF